ncbi:hypothetical protein [Sanyastnella coralliicola]|uniref:hypothetical protein n=1 Tax=Sanyastnella coralliicola TaxID=3069118 RepID=UPI0027BB158A|nr:hypothetical protein [Longitalea sp. SCSIO 12813]
MKNLGYILCFVLFIACGEAPPAEEENAQVEETATTSVTFDLSSVGVALEGKVPSWMPEGSFPVVTKDSNSGIVSITYSPELIAKLVPDSRSLSEAKLEIQDGAVFDVAILEEGSDLLMFEQKLPTGESVGVQIVRVIDVNGQGYHVYSDENIELTIHEARQLAECVNSLLVIQ